MDNGRYFEKVRNRLLTRGWKEDGSIARSPSGGSLARQESGMVLFFKENPEKREKGKWGFDVHAFSIDDGYSAAKIAEEIAMLSEDRIRESAFSNPVYSKDYTTIREAEEEIEKSMASIKESARILGNPELKYSISDKLYTGKNNIRQYMTPGKTEIRKSALEVLKIKADIGNAAHLIGMLRDFSSGKDIDKGLLRTSYANCVVRVGSVMQYEDVQKAITGTVSKLFGSDMEKSMHVAVLDAFTKAMLVFGKEGQNIRDKKIMEILENNREIYMARYDEVFGMSGKQFEGENAATENKQEEKIEKEKTETRKKGAKNTARTMQRRSRTKQKE